MANPQSIDQIIASMPTVPAETHETHEGKEQEPSPEEIAQKKAEAKIKQSWAYAQKIFEKVLYDEKAFEAQFPDVSNEEIFSAHSQLITQIATRICLKPQHRRLIIDERNKKLFRFLTYYFNNCRLAEEVYPEKRYKLEKPLLLIGDVGVGKSLIMQIFSEYLRRIDSPNAFYNVSVTQMVNYYTIHNNLDRFTYNEIDNPQLFEGNPFNICLNDVGVSSRPFFGMDTKKLTEEFLHARNEIWTQCGKKAHLTTNLKKSELEEAFNDDFGGRLIDRFKTYNIIYMTGESRR